MPSELHHVYEVGEEVDQSDVRAALSGVTDEDLSKKSPVTAGCRGVAVQVYDEGGQRSVGLSVEGHSGDWSKTSEQTIIRAVEGVDGVDGLMSSKGGYEG